MLNGINGRFKKGQVPANKGLKGVGGGYLPTCFKKGHIPINYKNVGSERISVDGYIEIKVADSNVWRPKHKVLWQNIIGAVTEGHTIIFADGNKQNLNIDNLVKVTRAELLYLNRNNLIFNDADLTKTSAKVAKLADLIFMRDKPEDIRVIKKFLKENKVNCIVQKSSNNTYIYFMDCYAIRISDNQPKSKDSVKTKITFNVGDYPEADGNIALCKKWILKILKTKELLRCSIC